MMSEDKTRELSWETFEFHRLYSEKVSRRLRLVHGETLPPVQYLLLSILVEQKRVTMGELGERALMQKQQLTKTVNQLEERGLAVRTRPGDDRRVVCVEATPLGEALNREIRAGLQSELSRIFSQLDEAELDEYLSCIRSINRILDRFPARPDGE